MERLLGRFALSFPVSRRLSSHLLLLALNGHQSFMPSDTTAAIDNALPLLIGLVVVVIVALLLTVRRCMRLARRQRGYNDASDDGETVTEQDLIEKRSLSIQNQTGLNAFAL